MPGKVNPGEGGKPNVDINVSKEKERITPQLHTI